MVAKHQQLTYLDIIEDEKKFAEFCLKDLKIIDENESKQFLDQIKLLTFAIENEMSKSLINGSLADYIAECNPYLLCSHALCNIIQDLQRVEFDPYRQSFELLSELDDSPEIKKEYFNDLITTKLDTEYSIINSLDKLYLDRLNEVNGANFTNEKAKEFIEYSLKLTISSVWRK
ncbi:MAG: hypothetical protein MHPSP_000480 [Paramarteilia canceri]